jgi:hypothetical protein
MIGAIPSDVQQLILQMAGPPAGARLMATSTALRQQPTVMYALRLEWWPRYVQAFEDLRRMAVQEAALRDALRARNQTLEAERVVMQRRIDGYSDRVNTRSRGESRRA